MVLRYPWNKDHSRVLHTLRKLRQVDVVLNRNHLGSDNGKMNCVGWLHPDEPLVGLIVPLNANPSLPVNKVLIPLRKASVFAANLTSRFENSSVDVTQNNSQRRFLAQQN